MCETFHDPAASSPDLVGWSDPLCDWLSISQTYEKPVEIFGKVLRTRTDRETGEVLMESVEGIPHEGSHSTSVFVSSNGHRVSLSGNIGRWGRRDNVYGYRFSDCVRRANQLVGSIGLPAFSAGTRFHEQGGRSGRARVGYTGARVSRIDLTRNFACGSMEQASYFSNWLGYQRIGRHEVERLQNTAYAGKGSKFVTTRVYAKGTEMASRRRKAGVRMTPGAEDYAALGLYQQRLAAWCDSVGLLRHEVSFKQKFLAQNGLSYLGGITDKALVDVYQAREKMMGLKCGVDEDVESLSWRERGVYNSYLRGEDCSQLGFSRATYFRYRKAILRIGIDIARPLNVQALRIRPRVIELRPVAPPQFYFEAASTA